MPLRSVALALALTLAGSPSERPRLQLWSIASSDDPDELAAIDARFELRARGELEARLDRARAPIETDAHARLAAVDAALERIRGAYLEQRWDAMEREALALESSDLTLLADPRRCASLWEIELRLALVYLSRKADGDAERAGERIAFALALDPERRPARDVYGPDVVGAFVAASERSSAQATRSIAITSVPADARLAVDCRELPRDHVAELRPGLHVVFARAAGHAANAALVRIPGEPRPELALTEISGSAIDRLAHSLDPDELDPRRAGDRRALAAAAAEDGSAGLVLTWPAGERVSARVLVGAAAGPTVVADDIASALRLALAQLDDRGRFVTATAVARERSPQDAATPKRSIVRKWWFWTILGTVVVGAVATGLALGLRDHPSQRLQIYAR